MIDNLVQTERLLARLQAALPVPARMTPEGLAAVRSNSGLGEVPPNCSVSWLSYGGDEAGIVCRLDFADATDDAVFVSITHLRFDPRLKLAREIVAYQKHRVKRLSRQG